MNTNQNWTINAPAGATYLSDFLTEIPANCLFNKKQTGCGATELAIRNSIPTIIAMPYVALVKNKTIYRKDDISVLGVYEAFLHLRDICTWKALRWKRFVICGKRI